MNPTNTTIPALEIRPAFLMQSEHYSTFADVVSALYSITPSTNPNIPSWESIDVGKSGVDCYAFIYSPLALGRKLDPKKKNDQLFVLHAIFDYMQSETQSPLQWEHVDEYGWLTAFKAVKWGVNVEEEFKSWEILRDTQPSANPIRKMV